MAIVSILRRRLSLPSGRLLDASIVSSHATSGAPIRNRVVKTSCCRRHYRPHVQRLLPSSSLLSSQQQRSWYSSTTVAHNDDDHNIEYSFVSRTIMIPHDSKKHRGGEDAAATNDRCLVLADGVGGWASEGVNPANFSRRLVQNVLDKVTSYSSMSTTTSSEVTDNNDDNNKGTQKQLAKLMQQANLETAQQHLGSATCTLLTVGSPSATTLSLNTVSVGDSGYAIFRRKTEDNNDSPSPKFQLEFVSPVGQKEFNFPYQLGGVQYGDNAVKVAVKETHQFAHEELKDYVIVVFTDGVSDNLKPSDFIRCLEAFWPITNNNSTDEEGGEQEDHLLLAADCLARMSYFLGKSPVYDSPFAHGARLAGWGDKYTGGKQDDITVTVAQLVRAEDRHSPSPPKEQQNDDDEEEVEKTIFMYTGDVPSFDAKE